MRQPLVIGASGLVGEHLVAALKFSGQVPVSTYRNTPIPSASALDITQQADVQNLFKSINPESIYLPAALTNVDYCETHPAETYETNVRSIQNVVHAANATSTKLIYFSSDYIFDGLAGPYAETDTASPISEYGRQKLEAEHYISLFANNYLIIRTTVVYGWERQGKNFVCRLVKSLRDGNPIKVPADQIGSPTYINNLAQIAVELANSPLNGVINITGPDCIGRYEFARVVAQIFELNEDLIIPVKTEELNQPARRPLKAGLKVAKVSAISRIPITNYRNGLKLMRRNMGVL